MWLSGFVLLTSLAVADRVEFVSLEPKAIPEAVLLDRYADLFDDGLRRRLGRERSRSVGISAEAQAEILGGAAAQAAGDWSMWVLKSVPTPVFQLPDLRARRRARPEPTRRLADRSAGVKPEGVAPMGASEDGSTRVATVPRIVEDRRAPIVRVALTPLWDTEGDSESVSAVVQASATGLGPSAWRLSSKPLSKTWSAWMRQDIVRGLSVVATADSASRKPKPAGVGGGAVLHLPSESLRIFARYGHRFARNDRLAEHQAAISCAWTPADRSRKRRRRS
jgi:hypothetical protein